jgi:hypothetical protein
MVNGGGVVGWVHGVCCAVTLTILAPGVHASTVDAPVPARAKSGASVTADFRGQSASPDVNLVANWAVYSGDHRGLPFMVLDKAVARLYAFDPSGRLVRATPVLLGMGIGDVFPPGVADMDMRETRPWQRVTPAGRFEAEIAPWSRGATLLWIDYDTGIALHKLPSRRTAQRRHERIRSLSAADKRVTYGCVNVPAGFYDQVVQPAYRAGGGIVYVLPETMSAAEVFGAYRVAAEPHSLLPRAQASASIRLQPAARAQAR